MPEFKDILGTFMLLNFFITCPAIFYFTRNLSDHQPGGRRAIRLRTLAVWFIALVVSLGLGAAGGALFGDGLPDEVGSAAMAAGFGWSLPCFVFFMFGVPWLF